MKVKPFHSKATRQVYHDCSKCQVGNNIEVRNRTGGNGGLRHCKECAKRIKEGSC